MSQGFSFSSGDHNNIPLISLSSFFNFPNRKTHRINKYKVYETLSWLAHFSWFTWAQLGHRAEEMASIGRPQSRGQMFCGKRIIFPVNTAANGGDLQGLWSLCCMGNKQQRRQCCNPGPGAQSSHKTLTLESSDCDLRLQNHILAFLPFLLSSPLFR